MINKLKWRVKIRMLISGQHLSKMATVCSNSIHPHKCIVVFSRCMTLLRGAVISKMITKEPIDTDSRGDSGSFRGGGTGFEDHISCFDQLGDYSARSSSTRDPCYTEATTDHEESYR